jgi:hypothetical protein
MSAVAALVAMALLTPALAQVQVYVEDFTTDAYMDAVSTTALWDTTGSGKISLHPFHVSVVGTTATAGIALSCVTHGDYVFVAESGTGIEVVDISDPSAPAVVGAYNTPGYSYALAVAGNNLYIADDTAGLQVLDITTPATPTYAGSYATPGKARGVAVAGNHAFVADRDGGVIVIDITDPASPTLAGSVATPGLALDIALSGDRAYVTNYEDGLQVIDISSPASPSIVGSHDTPGNAIRLAIDGDYVYVGDGGSGLQVFDVVNPSSPVLIGTYDTAGNAETPAVAGDYLYVADGSAGVLVFDVSDPAAPVVVDAYDSPGSAIGVTLRGEYAFLADRTGGLRVLGACQRFGPMVVAERPTPQETVNVSVAGNHAYLWMDDGHLGVFDVTEPTAPVLSDTIDLSGNYTWGLALAGNYAYAGGQSRIHVIDITNPASPTLAAHASTVADIEGLAVDGDFLFLAIDADPDSIAGVEIFDITNPLAPTSIGVCGDMGFQYWVRVAGDHAYVAGSYLRVLDISDPSNPTVVGNYEAVGIESSVSIEGDYAYLGAASFSPLYILDITDPTSPQLLSSFTPDMGPRVYNSLPDGDQVYLLQSDREVMDVSDPLNPYSAGRAGTSDPSWEAALAGDYLFVCVRNASRGLQVLQVYQRVLDTENDVVQSLDIEPAGDEVRRARLSSVQTDAVVWYLSADGGANWLEVPPDNSWVDFAPNAGSELLWKAVLSYEGGVVHPECTHLTIEWETEWAGVEDALPTRFALHQCAPNPFGPSAEIRYDVPAPGGHVEVKLFDVTGRLVRVLTDGHEAPGRKSLVWDGTDAGGERVASGVYYCIMETPSYRETRKMVLAK